MTTKLTPQYCIELLRQNNCSEHVIQHCLSVRDLAIKIAEYTNADKDLIEAGALLHDIGRGHTHGIQHGIIGAEIAQNLGLPQAIINIIERHIGAGIPSEEAVQLGLPNKDFIPVTLEEKIVTHADNLIEGNKKVSINNEIQKAIQKEKKTYANRLQKLHDELTKICGIDLDLI